MKITLVPIAGLCNRINAMTCGLLFKRENPDCEFMIKWWKTHDCCANFSDLFDAKYFPLEVGKMTSLLKDRPATPRNMYIPRKVRHLFYDIEINPRCKLDCFYDNIKGKEKIYIAVCNNFCNLLLTKSIAEIFVPAEDIRCKIDNITKDWGNNVIGLHIRRTDNAKAIQNSPINHFYDVIEKELTLNSNTKFYLATDDEELKTEFKQKYGSRIITLDLKLKRNSVEGMKDAVVDLYCLGKTSKIYGSHHSTYSIIASQLYNIPLIV